MQRHSSLARVARSALAVVAACGQSASEPGPPDGGAVNDGGRPAPPVQEAPPVDAGAPPDAGGDGAAVPVRCDGKKVRSGDSTTTVTSSGRGRTARVHVPASYDPSLPSPVVLAFHAFGSDAIQAEIYTGITRKADEASFVAVYPQGLVNSWNGGACCGEAARTGVDDVRFVADLLDVLEDELCIDRRRVFATGMSNGAFFSHRLGCELSTRIAAIAPVAGVLGVPACTPSRRVPVIEFHGTSDTVVPFGGSAALGFGSVTETVDGWANRNGCSASETVTFQTGDSRCAKRTPCSDGASVVLCTVTGGGHTWPGAAQIPGVYTTASLSATDALWEFFEAHPLPTW